MGIFPNAFSVKREAVDNDDVHACVQFKQSKHGEDIRDSRVCSFVHINDGHGSCFVCTHETASRKSLNIPLVGLRSIAVMVESGGQGENAFHVYVGQVPEPGGIGAVGFTAREPPHFFVEVLFRVNC